MPPTLLLPPHLTASAEAVRAATEARGLTTVQLPTFDLPEGIAAEHLHAGPTFTDAVAPSLGIACLEAPPTWLEDLPREVVGRTITAMPILDAWTLRYPAFIKAPNDKSLRAMVYTDGTRLPGADAVDPDTLVLVAEIVSFTAEFRLFALDGTIHTSSQYAARGRRYLAPLADDVTSAAAALIRDLAETLPSAIVVDVGLLDDRLVVIEANAAWASGTYASDVDRALDVILRAAGPVAGLLRRDEAFTRPVPGRSSSQGMRRTVSELAHAATVAPRESPPPKVRPARR
ncbi:ATP-grasp domain-containing protein [Myceligenerans indicum]|uniref:ATP-grasp domain-containing protein n=1 Tax=Myceligenerans indicum TaxID=2593663 RepID=A0ABS1LQN4_9MICO|nr:ATP-grasp domain-containing protein [Myceligenerans indicum]MBL0888309.1 ATP-grasp domain-containing protein [Myceligenerans indicum]